MKSLAVLLTLCHILVTSLAATAQDSFLRATAIVTTSANISAIECWQFTEPVVQSTDSGTSGAATYTFLNTAESVYTVIPGRFDGGLHVAPAPQLVAFMSGLAHVTLPTPAYGNKSLDEAWITGGANGFIIAVDVEGSGHTTVYPTDQLTIALQIPFKSIDDIPAHDVVGPGPCHLPPSGSQIV